jgi:hypothetical protein
MFGFDRLQPTQPQLSTMALPMTHSFANSTSSFGNHQATQSQSTTTGPHTRNTFGQPLAYTHVFPEGWNTLPDEMKLHILKYTVPSDYTYYASHFQRDGSYRSYKALSALE